MSGFQEISAPKMRLADEAYRQILNVIQSGGFAYKERIVQEKLAAQLQISRTPVREALLRLEQEGLLINAGRGGFLIQEMSPDDVREIYQARIAVESFAIHLLAKEKSDDEASLKKIERVIVKEEAIKKSTATLCYNANRTIHRAFVEQAQNQYLLDMFDNLWNRGTCLHLFTSFSSADLEQSLSEHTSLLDAIRTGNSNHAMAVMSEHIGDGLELQLHALPQN